MVYPNHTVSKINHLKKENKQLKNKIADYKRALNVLKCKDCNLTVELLKREIENCLKRLKFNEETIKDIKERLRS
ncbi:hypothetical protein ACO3VM_02800 [Methanocaldococcus sp. 10A]